MPFFLRPFFRNGRLVRPGAITRLDAGDMQAADRWLEVSSSNVRAIRWRPSADDDGGRGGLGIWFSPENGPDSTYWYGTATYDVYEQMRAYPSKGRFIHEVLLKSHSHTAGPLPGGSG